MCVIVYKHHRKICQIFFQRTSCHLKCKSNVPWSFSKTFFWEADKTSIFQIQPKTLLSLYQLNLFLTGKLEAGCLQNETNPIFKKS